ncbi:MAG: PAS domain-containing protein [Alphaproteobacteria bacterium]|nr:PAS domain-containing protein [Alphaproteobacteria bacterium]
MSGKVSLPDTIPEDSDLEVQEIVRYWQSIHRNGELPDRRQIDPCDIPDLLPGIALVDIERSPFRFKFRLLGERMNLYHGRNFTGRWLDEVFPHFDKTETPKDFIFVTEQGNPSYRLGRPLMTFEKSFIEMERVFLPFRNGRASVDLVMAYTIFR